MLFPETEVQYRTWNNAFDTDFEELQRAITPSEEKSRARVFLL